MGAKMGIMAERLSRVRGAVLVPFRQIWRIGESPPRAWGRLDADLYRSKRGEMHRAL